MDKNFIDTIFDKIWQIVSWFPRLDDNHKIGYLWFTFLGYCFGWVGTIEMLGLYYGTFYFQKSDLVNELTVYLPICFAILNLAFFTVLHRIFEFINKRLGYKLFSTDINDQVPASIFSTIGGILCGSIGSAAMFTEEKRNLIFNDPEITAQVIYITVTMGLFLYTSFLTFNQSEEEKQDGTHLNETSEVKISPITSPSDHDSWQPDHQYKPLIEIWQGIRQMFKKMGYDVRTPYEDEQDLLWHNLLLLESNQYTDKVYLERTVKLYSKILEELKNRDRKLFKKSEEVIQKTLTELSADLIEHEQKYEKYSLLHLNTTLTAIGKFIKLRQ